jgi:hypothetical protein
MHQWLGVIHQIAKINVDLTPINQTKRLQHRTLT